MKISETIDLELVNQKLADGKALLMAKREGIGYIERMAVGDVTGDGKKEIIVGTDVGVVMALSPACDEGRQAFGEELWRFEHAEFIPEEFREVIIIYGEEELWRFEHSGFIRRLATADLNSDGKDEVIVASKKEMMVLNADGKLDWKYFVDPVRDMAVVDLGNGVREIVAVTGKVIKIFSANGMVISELEVPFDDRRMPDKIAIFDADSSGEYKIVVATPSMLYLFRKNGEMIWRRTLAEDRGGPFIWYIATADLKVESRRDESSGLKGDGKALILVGHDNGITAFGSEGEEIWRFSGGCVHPIAVGDVDGDGRQEIAAVTIGGGVNLYMLDSDGKELWRYNIGSWIPSIAIADVNNDGKKEIIAGGGEWNLPRSGIPLRGTFVSIINSKGILEQKYNTGYHVFSLVCDDIDGDGDVEIIAGSADLHVFSHSKRKWQYRSGGRYKIALADIDGDGAAEIIMGANSTTAYKGNGKALWCCDTGQVKHLVTGKIDGARGEEIVIDSGFNNLIYLDSQGKIKWKRKRRRVVPGPPPAIADINNDGQNEIILGTEALYVFDASGYELWSFQAPGSRHHVLCIATGNVDGYDGSEIIMSCPPGLWVLDGEGEVLWNYLRPLSEEQRAADPRRREYEYLDIISIVAVDIDKDGKDEVIAVSADKLYCFDDNGNLLWEVEPPRRSGKTMGIYIETKRRLVSCADLNDDGNLEIISAVGGLCIYSTAGEELWGVASSGEINDIAVCDINGDGQKEILVASDELEIFSNDGERIFNCEAGVGCLESVSVGDVDGDGIPEIVVGGCGVYVLKPTTN